MKRYFAVFLTFIAAFMLSNCGESRHTPAPVAQAPAAVQVETSSPAAPIPAIPAAPILASGADPERSIHVGAGIITVKIIDGALSIYPFVKPRFAAGSATFAIGEGSYATTLTLESGPCRDRTFKTTDNMTAKASIRGRNVGGCAHRADSETNEAARDWVSRIFDLVPAIRACLARAQADGTQANRIDPRLSHDRASSGDRRNAVSSSLRASSRFPRSYNTTPRLACIAGFRGLSSIDLRM